MKTKKNGTMTKSGSFILENIETLALLDKDYKVSVLILLKETKKIL